ncbi:MAG: VanW family protein, partial [Clostridia bacterium]|nr:VanW family protein [Clostridia bacterium]
MKKNLLRVFLVMLLTLILTVSFSGCAQIESLFGGKEESSASSDPEAITDPNLFAHGTFIGSTDISGMTVEEAKEACRKAALSEYKDVKVTVKFGDKGSLELTGEDVTLVDTLDYALKRMLKDRDGSTDEYHYELDFTGLTTYIEENAEKLSVAAVDAAIDRFDTEKGELLFVESVEGVAVDRKATAQAVAAQFKKKQSGTVEAAMVVTPPAVTTEQIKEQFALISEFTTVSTNTENGNHNMALALSKVNESMILPGEVFSFEGKVGKSTTADTGFKPANGILDGILVPMYGGGICQASTTLYGAVLRAGMTIVERGSHSIPSTYVKIGQDAAVSYRQLDFKFKNDTETPVYLVAWMKEKTLYARIYGTKSTEWDTIEVYSEQTATLDRLETVTYKEDPALEKGVMEQVSEGNFGYRAIAWRDFIKDGEVVRSENLLPSYYRPTGPTYKMGPGTDPNATPTPAPTEAPTPAPT